MAPHPPLSGTQCHDGVNGAEVPGPHQGEEAMMNLGTLDQAAQALGCSARTVRRHIEAGRLDAYRNHAKRGILVDLDAVANLAQPRKITR